MVLKELFTKQSPSLTDEQAQEAESALLRYFELLYKVHKGEKKNNGKINS